MNDRKNRVWAKPKTTLEEHTDAVLDAAELLFGEHSQTGSILTDLGRSFLRFFKVDEKDKETFLATLRVAVILHDIGKSNQSFFDAIEAALYKGFKAQHFRHEHLSAFVLYKFISPYIQDRNVNIDIATLAILHHHLKILNILGEKESFLGCPETGQNTLLLFHLIDVQILLKKIGIDSKPPKFPKDLNDETIRIWRENFADNYLEDTASKFKKRENRLFRAVKSALICADAVGSASNQNRLKMKSFIKECFNVRPFTSEDIEQLIINPRIDEIKKAKGGFSWHSFQNDVSKMGLRAFLMSSCGSGKTLAAYKWASELAKTISFKNIIFLYPTRATSREGFKDYSSWAGEIATLQHATSRFDLQDMFSETDDDFDKRHETTFTVDEKLFALGYWNKRIFSATVDQFLSFINHKYSAICMLPVLTQSVIIFDEVHSYDKNMFASLERFLDEFNVPVLCMTATLDEERKKSLEKRGLNIFPTQNNFDAYTDLTHQNEHKRYSISYIKQEIDNIFTTILIPKAISYLKKNKKVLWICNTIARAQHIATLLQQYSPLCYHSNFIVTDRKQRHIEVIDAFHSSTGCLAVTTQVCEMSLDIDADLIICEVSPVPPLIQRLGRGCRDVYLRHEGEQFCEVIFYYPESMNMEPAESPYASDEFLMGVKFCEYFNGKLASQKDLTEYLKTLNIQKPPDRSLAFLDDITYAKASEDPFREQHFSVDCVLDNQKAEYLRKKLDKNPDVKALARGHILSIGGQYVGKKIARQDKELGKYVYLVSSLRYNSFLGFQA